MRNRKLLVMIMAMVFMLLNACAWVELTPGGEKVRVLSKQEVSSCKHVGKTTATVADDVAGLKRKEHIVKQNLEMLARNAAAEMSGDTIVPASAIKDGNQTFEVYKCVGK